MAEFPALPLFTDAYLADTHPELSLEEHGCYMLLLQAAWRRPNCDLPDDDRWFCRWLGIHGNKWNVLKASVLHRFFVQSESGSWYQRRLRKERDFVEKSRRNRSEMGKKGNAVRWGNNDLGDRQAIAPTPTPTPIKKERKKKNIYPSFSASDEPSPDAENREAGDDQETIDLTTGAPSPGALFAEWWKNYPRKVGRLAAERAYYIALKRATPAVILDGLHRAVATWKAAKTETEYIPHPATWLNGGRWMDQHQPKPPATNRPTSGYGYVPPI